MSVKILIVEDDADVRELLVLMVGAARPADEVAAACDGALAVEVCRERGPFDLAILDVMMPRMDGEEAARVILELAPFTVVVFLTGYSLASEKAVRLRAMGDIWQKPGAVDNIGEKIARALAGRGVGCETGTHAFSS